MADASTPLAIVFDTNVIVSGTIVPAGLPASFLAAWRQGRFTLLTSPEQLAELARTLRRPVFARKYGVDDVTVNALINQLRQSARIIEPPTEALIAVRDPDDERILMIALAGRANYLVTGDDDLLAIATDQRLEGLKIVTVRDFRQAFDAR